MLNTTGLRPLGRAVLVEPLESDEIKSEKLVIPDMVKDRLMMAEQQALVIEVGPMAWYEERFRFLGIPLWRVPRAKPGDKVMISKYAGMMTVSPVTKKQYRVVNANDIFLKIT